MSQFANIAALFNLRRISGQIAALILVSLVLIHVLIGVYFFMNRPTPMAQEPIQQFEFVAKIIANTPRPERNGILETISHSFPNLQLQLRDERQNSNERSSDRPRMRLPTFLDGDVEVRRGASPEEDDRIKYYLPDGHVLEAAIRAPKLPGFISGLWISTLLFLVASITLLGVWAGRALSSPLSAFARAAENFSLSKSSDPLPESGPEEIRSTAQALNRMRDRITALMNDRTRMLAAISHDLRTPITRLRLRSELIEDSAQRSQIRSDLDQMQSMLESVLTLLRSEGAAKPTLVDVAILLQTVCDQFSDCGHTVGYQGPSRATLTIRPDEIIRAITNLVDNAVRFGTQVSVELSATGDRAVIDVSDNGPGIPNEKKAAMLEPFTRGEQARTMDETTGFGLGLSIAEAIVAAHGGSLTLHDNVPNGLCVRLTLPNAQKSSEDKGRGEAACDAKVSAGKR